MLSFQNWLRKYEVQSLPNGYANLKDYASLHICLSMYRFGNRREFIARLIAQNLTIPAHREFVRSAVVHGAII